MKANYIIVLLIISNIVFGFMAFTRSECSTSGDSLNSGLTLNTSDTVGITRALNQIDMYETWISHCDSVLKDTSRNYVAPHNSPGTNDISLLATSYYIKKEDLKTVYDKINEDSTLINGARAYIAIENIGTNKDPDYESHMYIGPAYHDTKTNSYKDYYFFSSVNKGYLLDLTTPCPKACARTAMQSLPSK